MITTAYSSIPAPPLFFSFLGTVISLVDRMEIENSSETADRIFQVGGKY